MTPTENERLCAHCIQEEVTSDSMLCETCGLLPRCEICDCFFDGLFPQSSKNPRRCESCFDFEERIKFNCRICLNELKIYYTKKGGVLSYVVRGNFCPTCNSASHDNGKAGKEKEEKTQFVGYLAMVEKFYNAGSIGKEEWEYAIKMNRHDVNYIKGIEYLFEEEETELEVTE